MRQNGLLSFTLQFPKPDNYGSLSSSFKKYFSSWSGHGRLGPRIRLSLPSFSGRTADEPEMLRYACQLDTNARLVKPLKVSFKAKSELSDTSREGSLEDIEAILGGKPVVAVAFDKMKMVVHQPVPVVEKLDQAQWQLQKDKQKDTVVSDGGRYLQVS